MEKKGEFLFVTKNGMVKRSAAADYGIRRARFAAINLKGDDELIGMAQVDPGDKGDLLIATGSGMAIRFKLDTIPTTGRATAGVKGITLEEGDAVRWFELPKAGDILFVVSDRGIGKRMLSDDVERQNRAGKGQKLLPMTKNGALGTELAACVNATGAVRFVIEQKHGHQTQLSSAEVPVERRSGKGTMLVSVLLDDVVTYAGVLSE